MKCDKIDLHTHSNFSDGLCTPSELIKLADEYELGAIALTDHDTIDGIAEFMFAARCVTDVIAVPGVEISTNCFNREVHIVGLFISPDNTQLKYFLDEAKKERNRRNISIAAKLTQLGYAIDVAMLKQNYVEGRVIGRPHFARYLVDHFDFVDTDAVFSKLLRRGAPAYVKRELPEPEEAIAVIHAAGGIAVWAHPIYRQYNERSWCRKVLKRLVPAGLNAIEAYYVGFDGQQTAIIRDLALSFGLALSGGSDFHGRPNEYEIAGKRGASLPVPGELLKELLDRAGNLFRDNS